MQSERVFKWIVWFMERILMEEHLEAAVEKEEIGKEMACRGNREKNKILETSYESMAENYIDSGL